MRAAYVTELGSAEKIQIGELPRPTVGASDVLVRTQALAVNSVDTLIRSGRYPTLTPLPFGIRRDLVGIVAAGGDGVDCFRAADRDFTSHP
jgi:NADPH:quinone reductase-like Zn-dependent oxidoreductase